MKVPGAWDGREAGVEGLADLEEGLRDIIIVFDKR